MLCAIFCSCSLWIKRFCICICWLREKYGVREHIYAVGFEWEKYCYFGDDEILDVDYCEDVLDRNLMRLKSMYGMSLRVGKKHIVTSCSAEENIGEFMITITQEDTE